MVERYTTCMRMLTNIAVHRDRNTDMQVKVCMYIYIYICVCVYVCVYVYGVPGLALRKVGSDDLRELLIGLLDVAHSFQ